MKKGLPASLCHEGIHGGALLFGDAEVTFVCRQLTVEEKYHNYRMPYREIASAAPSGRAMLVFPAVTVTMKNGESIRFLVFCRKTFLGKLEEKRRECRTKE